MRGRCIGKRVRPPERKREREREREKVEMVSVAVFVMAPFLIYEKARPTAGAGRTRVREGGPGRGGHGPSCCRSCPWIGGGGGRGGGLSPDIANAVLAPSLLGLSGAGRLAGVLRQLTKMA